jgi:hypothetical protein
VEASAILGYDKIGPLDPAVTDRFRLSRSAIGSDMELSIELA